MRFMILRKADSNTEQGVMPDTELLGAMGKYADEMMKAGVMLGGEGLKPTSEGVRVKFDEGQPRVTDGPSAETRELVAGYLMIQVPSKAEAVEWAKRWPALDGDVELEIRAIFEEDDFGDTFTPEQREAEARMRTQLAE